MSKRILVMDNDLGILDMMQEVLSDEGFQVTTSAGAENIHALIAGHQPDLLIIDYILEGINGGEYCRQVKNSPATASLPILMFSAYPRVLKSLGSYGADAFLAKPFDLAELLEKVNLLVNTPGFNEVAIAS